MPRGRLMPIGAMVRVRSFHDRSAFAYQCTRILYFDFKMLQTPQTTTIITGDRRLRPADVREVWRSRDLLWLLATRDLKVRYKQTVLGVAWAFIQPLAMMFVFIVLFRLLGKTPARGDTPYAWPWFVGR